jgi:molecular chaperone DnaK (HSP70)
MAEMRNFSAFEIIERAKTRAGTVTGDDNSGPSELVIGIDFGTTYTGVAYAISSSITRERFSPRTLPEAEALIEKVRIIKNWPNAIQQTAEKTPTMLAYENGAMVAWGAKVKPNHRKQIAIAHFKLGLHENVGRHYGNESSNSASLLGGFLRNSNWRHESLPNKSAIDFTTDYLTAIRKFVMESVLPSHYGKTYLNSQQISYALTVPAIWSDKAKDLTRQAAIQAGISADNLVLISEPEAAALYCATMCTEVDLKDGDRFLVCDAGGGTVVFPFSMSPLMIGFDLVCGSITTAIHHQ